MRYEINGVLLYEGILKKISFSEIEGKAYLEFSDGIIFEFRNGKSNRSDHVKKLRLQSGEHLIAIGAISKSSDLYIFGYDVQRKGYLKKENYYLFHGTVEKYMCIGNTHIIYLNNGTNVDIVKILNRSGIRHIESGEQITCICATEQKKPFLLEANAKKRKKRFVALEIKIGGFLL